MPIDEGPWIAPDERTLDEIGRAVAEFMKERLVDPDDDELWDAARDRLEKRFFATTSHLDELQRGHINTCLSMLGSISFDIRLSPGQAAEREAEGVLRSAFLDELHAQYDRGERDLVWPPHEDTEWDEVRVAVAQFMERKAHEWPRIALAEQPMMLHSPFHTAEQGALFFMGLWLKADSRTELLRHIDEVHLQAWEEYLELPPKADEPSDPDQEP
jgi:hypothetical protein